MGLAQVYEFVAASFLILTLLANSSAACTCETQYHYELWKQACASDFVISGMFVGAAIGDPEWNWARYDFKTTEVYKKPDYLPEITALYTQLQGSTCEYRHNSPFDDKEYMVAGKVRGYRAIISQCSYIKLTKYIYRNQIPTLRESIATKCPAWIDKILG